MSCAPTLSNKQADGQATKLALLYYFALILLLLYSCSFLFFLCSIANLEIKSAKCDFTRLPMQRTHKFDSIRLDLSKHTVSNGDGSCEGATGRVASATPSGTASIASFGKDQHHPRAMVTIGASRSRWRRNIREESAPNANAAVSLAGAFAAKTPGCASQNDGPTCKTGSMSSVAFSSLSLFRVLFSVLFSVRFR